MTSHTAVTWATPPCSCQSIVSAAAVWICVGTGGMLRGSVNSGWRSPLPGGGVGVWVMP